MCIIVYGTTSSATSTGDTNMSGAERFTVTSTGPYDRHTYEVVLANGDKKNFDTWEVCQAFWFQTTAIGLPKVVNVIDKPKKNKKSNKKGF